MFGRLIPLLGRGGYRARLGSRRTRFPTWAPADLDKYRIPPDWAIGAKNHKSTLIDVWERSALNRSPAFALLYGNRASPDIPHLEHHRKDVEKIYTWRIRNPNSKRFPSRCKRGPDSIADGHRNSKSRPTLSSLYEK